MFVQKEKQSIDTRPEIERNEQWGRDKTFYIRIAIVDVAERTLIAKREVVLSFNYLLSDSRTFIETRRECHIYYRERREVRFLKRPFNIALAIARTKALCRSAWNGTGSGCCSSVPCNAAYTGCMYVRECACKARLYSLRAPLLLPVILTVSCRTFAFAMHYYEG